MLSKECCINVNTYSGLPVAVMYNRLEVAVASTVPSATSERLARSSTRNSWRRMVQMSRFVIYVFMTVRNTRSFRVLTLAVVAVVVVERTD